jgi:hypothetical protein
MEILSALVKRNHIELSVKLPNEHLPLSVSIHTRVSGDGFHLHFSGLGFKRIKPSWISGNAMNILLEDDVPVAPPKKGKKK